MWTLRRKHEKPRGASSAAELEAEIDSLTRENQAARSPAVERRLLELRHDLGFLRLGTNGSEPRHPDPDGAALAPFHDGLPEIGADQLTPELLRAGILRDGCLLVRGLFDRDAALGFADGIDRAFAEREVHDAGGEAADGLYAEFVPRPGPSDEMTRDWIKLGGGVLAADSPRLAFSMLEMFAAAGLGELVRGYLGETPLISAQKTTLRKAEPSVAGAWHQDGRFMGPVRALNLWLSLSRCGDEAPGLDIVPRRLDDFVSTQTDEAMLDYQVSQKQAVRAAGDRAIVRPIFEPGDAMFFDDLCLHKTGSDPTMPKPRYAIENWFFGASAFPAEYAPIAV
jgi:hypothetical protein